MILLGRMDVDRLLSEQEALAELGEDVYPAKYHVRARDQTALRFDRVVPENIARSIETDRGANLSFASNRGYRLGPNALRPRMWLTDESAQSLDTVIDFYDSLPVITAGSDGEQSRPQIRMAPIEAGKVDDYETRSLAARRTAVRRERLLVDSYCAYMRAQGDLLYRHEISFIDSARRIYSDIFNITRKQLIEAKANAERTDIRMAIGQLADYGRFTPGARAVLLPRKPTDDLCDLLETQSIAAIWKHGPGFHDTADGEFTTRRRGTPT